MIARSVSFRRLLSAAAIATALLLPAATAVAGDRDHHGRPKYYGHESSQGQGYGKGYGHGQGYGHHRGSGHGQGHGYGYGQGYGKGYGSGYGQGYGHGNGYGNGHGRNHSHTRDYQRWNEPKWHHREENNSYFAHSYQGSPEGQRSSKKYPRHNPYVYHPAQPSYRH